MENMNNQGKRPEQYENSAKFAGYGILGMIILLIIITLLGGCVTTNEVPKKCCEKENITKRITTNEAAEHATKHCGGDLENGNKK